MTFADLGLGPEILKAVEEAGYTSPTPIQEQAIPVVLMGRDVLGVAQTGTGKTAGFTLPMIEILAGSRAKARMPRSLILAPTRELASQVAENFEKYGKYHRLTMAKLIGGESFADQEKVLDRGVDVLIATPGRLMDLFDRGRILLNDVKILVIDEADRMLDMGFIPDVERIVSLLPKIRQTLFFSATMAPEIRRLADAFLMNPKEISVAPQASTATTVEQFLVVCEEIDKREALRHLIRVEDVKNAFIFCNRKRDVDILYRSLTRHGLDAGQLHGDMPQSARTETLEKFRRGEVRLMVCSDVAARGIDISDLSHVFNFDVPHHAEDYVHRIGRTGRAGKEGRAFTIATPDDGKFMGAILKLIGKEIPRVSIEGLPELPLDLEGAPRSRGGARGRGRKGEERPARERQKRHKGEQPVHEAAHEEALAAPAREAERLREPVRNRDRDRDRGDRRREYRRRDDDHGIGEMTHSDGVVGFGAHVPDFILQEIVLPKPVEKAAEQPVEAPATEAEKPAEKKPRKKPAKTTEKKAAKSPDKEKKAPARKRSRKAATSDAVTAEEPAAAAGDAPAAPADTAATEE